MPLAPRATTLPAPYVWPPSQSWDGNDGSWSTFEISVGTPPQTFRILPSTAGSETWVPAPEGCTPSDPTNCASLRGAEPFNGVSSTGFQTNQSSTWNLAGLYGLDLEAVLNYTGNGQYGYDTIQLGSSGGPSLKGQVLAAIADKSYFLGIFGLGIRPTSFSSSSPNVPSYLKSLQNQTKIPSLSYGYTAGAPYQGKKVLGSLVLGGYDQSRLKIPQDNSKTPEFSFSSDDARTLTVGVQSIVASNTQLGVVSMTTGGHLSLIDSTIPHIWLPRPVCDLFEKNLGLTYDPQTDLYIVNDTTHATLQQLNPNFTFKLGNTAFDNGNSTNIELPYKAFDLQASYPIYQTPTNYFPIRRAANDSQYVLGRTFLQQAYLIVDYERRNFSVFPAAFPDSSNTRIVTISSPGNSNGGGNGSGSSLPAGAIAGIVVGAIALISIIAAFFLIRRRKQQKTKVAELANTQVTPAEGDAEKSGDKKDSHLDAPQELGANAITELESPGPGRDRFSMQKSPIAATPEGTMSELASPSVVHEAPGDMQYYEMPGDEHYRK